MLIFCLMVWIACGKGNDNNFTAVLAQIGVSPELSVVLSGINLSPSFPRSEISRSRCFGRINRWGYLLWRAENVEVLSGWEWVCRFPPTSCDQRLARSLSFGFFDWPVEELATIVLPYGESRVAANPLPFSVTTSVEEQEEKMCPVDASARKTPVFSIRTTISRCLREYIITF